MHRSKTIVFNIAFALNCLLLFLVLFEQQLQIPVWLQVAGRMHPLILHFPIVLLVMAALWELLPRPQSEDTKIRTGVGDVLLLSASLTAVLTSLFGLFLSREPGYEADVLFWHKWGGVLISFLTLGWFAFRQSIRSRRPVLFTATAVGMALILLTGHQGANITHGENFLLAPLHSGEETQTVLLEDAVVYAHLVKPILEAKCTGCHNPRKAKGELVMETEAELLKGGKSGQLWDTTKKGFGLLFERLHLPLDNKKHMPPRGKPQLTEEEIAILYQWVKCGADFKQKVLDLPETDTLRLLAAERFQTIETDAYTFDAASDEAIKKLSTSYLIVSPLAAGSPALGVEFFSAANYKAAALKDLLAIKEQVVSLNLNKMPVTDGDLQTISQFKNLRKLNLSFTNISGATLRELKGMAQLRQLSLSGTPVKWKDVQPLTDLPKLSRLYLWNTGIAAAEMKQAMAGHKKLSLEGGYRGDTVVLKLNAPVLENEEQIVLEPVPLKLKHPIKGASIRYTTDGSEPDSLKSPAFDGRLMVDRSLVVKAKAFKPGWMSSDVLERTFYKVGFKPDSVSLQHEPNPLYKGDGAAVLTDAQKGDQNFRTPKWLGFKETPLAAFLYLKQPVELSAVTLSSLLDINSYIMPPQQVEVWGGSDPAHLRLLKRLAPEQPKEMKPNSLQGYTLSFAPAKVKVIKVVATPLQRLPSWHPGKGQKGWVFVDEIFLN